MAAGDPAPPQGAAAIAGFWRRTAAFAIDILVLAVPMMALGLALFRWAASLGQAGRVVGLIVALAYFGLLDSRVGGGRTVGKRLLGIRVVDAAARPLSPARAALRFLVVAASLFGGGLWLDPLDPPSHALLVLLAIAWLGITGALLYLLAFNLPGRQSLHDLAVGGFVVRGGVPASMRPTTRRVHFVVIGAWLLFLIPAVPGTAALTGGNGWYGAAREPMAKLRDELSAHPAIGRLRVLIGVARTGSAQSGPTWTTYLLVDAHPLDRQDEPKALILTIAAWVLDRHPDLLGQDVLVVRVTRGFDLGLARWSYTYRAAFDGATWRRLIEQQPLPGRGRQA